MAVLEAERNVAVVQVARFKEEAQRWRGLAVAATNMYWGFGGSSYDAHRRLAVARAKIRQMQEESAIRIG